MGDGNKREGDVYGLNEERAEGGREKEREERKGL